MYFTNLPGKIFKSRVLSELPVSSMYHVRETPNPSSWVGTATLAESSFSYKQDKTATSTKNKYTSLVPNSECCLEG